MTHICTVQPVKCWYMLFFKKNMFKQVLYWTYKCEQKSKLMLCMCAVCRVLRCSRKFPGQAHTNIGCNHAWDNNKLVWALALHAFAMHMVKKTWRSSDFRFLETWTGQRGVGPDQRTVLIRSSRIAMCSRCGMDAPESHVPLPVLELIEARPHLEHLRRRLGVSPGVQALGFELVLVLGW